MLTVQPVEPVSFRNASILKVCPQSPSLASTYFTMPDKKRLIICCDGTWQASDKPDATRCVESNVTRMCRAVKEVAHTGQSEIQQVVYYQSGIGTDTMSWLSRKFAGKITREALAVYGEPILRLYRG